MIEKTVLNYLKSRLTVSVSMETPSEPTAEYVLIEKTGSGIEDGISSATIAVQSYAASLYKAAVLNETVKNKLLNMADCTDIYRIVLNSDYNFTDTETKKYRYQAVFNITY